VKKILLIVAAVVAGYASIFGAGIAWAVYRARHDAQSAPPTVVRFIYKRPAPSASTAPTPSAIRDEHGG
jgi:biotin transporter BioY